MKLKPELRISSQCSPVNTATIAILAIFPKQGYIFCFIPVDWEAKNNIFE